MTRRRSVAGLAQPRAPRPKTVTKRLRMEPQLAAATESAAGKVNRTWTSWATEALELALARGSTN